jgi:queuosine biosynthesis protein QueC
MGIPQQVVSLPPEVFGGSLVRAEQPVDGVLPGGLPTTFTPGRNLVFLTLAAAFAASLVSSESPIPDLVTGVCQTDYSGYPDCRERTMEALGHALSLGTGRTVQIVTPLMHMTKTDTVRLMVEMGGYDLLAHSVTCYRGDVPGCGTCPSCVLRVRGFATAGVRDPAQSEERWKELYESWKKEGQPVSGQR